MSNFQFVFIVTLIVSLSVDNYFNESKKSFPDATWKMRAIAISITTVCNLTMALIVATIVATVHP